MPMLDSDLEFLDRAVSPKKIRPTKRRKNSRRGRKRTGRAFLNSPPVRKTFVTVMHPRIKTQDHRSWTMADYVAVPRLSIRGTHKLPDMLSDDSIRALLTINKNLRRGHSCNAGTFCDC